MKFWKITQGLILSWLVVAGFTASAGNITHDEINKLLVEAEQFFRDANEMSVTDPEAASGLYKKAIIRYERIINEGGIRNGMLYYNTGNAYFKIGDLGRAILFYRRAEQYMPGNENLRRNLDFVLGMREDRIEEGQKTRVLKTLFSWHYLTTFSVRAWLFIVMFSSVWALASIYLFYRKAALKWTLVPVVFLSLVLFTSLAAESIELAVVRPGVILSEQVVPRRGDGDAYAKSFEQPLHAGSEFVLVEKRGLWSHIELADGRRCWVPTRSIGFVR